MPVIYFANTNCINRSLCFCYFVGLKFQKFLAYVADTLLGHAFGNVDLIEWNLKNVLLCSVFADLVTYLFFLKEMTVQLESNFACMFLVKLNVLLNIDCVVITISAVEVW